MSLDPVSVRMLSQHLCSPKFRTPEEVVSHFGAMQAQEYRMMRWAVSMRTVRPSEKAFRQAYDEGRIIRLHLHRGTWQLVTRDDYWWMLRLCGPRSEAAIRGWMHSNRIDIPEDELMNIRELLVAEAGRGGSVTKEDFVRALAGQGITMDDHRLSYHIRMAELSGTLCSGDLHPRKATYSLVHAKIGPELVQPDRDDSLALLARKYFRSHSPATLEDFVWWSGLGVADCRRAMALLGGELHSESISGRAFHIHTDCRTRGFRKGRLVLLPPYDEYLIGYKSRDVVLDPDLSHRAHNRTGLFYPVILKDGRVCGNWKPTVLGQLPTAPSLHSSPAAPSDLSLSLFEGDEVDGSAAAMAIDAYLAFVEGNKIKRRL